VVEGAHSVGVELGAVSGGGGQRGVGVAVHGGSATMSKAGFGVA
jgi:hypothetical protein